MWIILSLFPTPTAIMVSLWTLDGFCGNPASLFSTYYYWMLPLSRSTPIATWSYSSLSIWTISVGCWDVAALPSCVDIYWSPFILVYVLRWSDDYFLTTSLRFLFEMGSNFYLSGVMLFDSIEKSYYWFRPFAIEDLQPLFDIEF